MAWAQPALVPRMKEGNRRQRGAQSRV